jgi:hypothetical protein
MKNVYFLSDAHLGSRAIAHGRRILFWNCSSSVLGEEAVQQLLLDSLQLAPALW